MAVLTLLGAVIDRRTRSRRPRSARTRRSRSALAATVLLASIGLTACPAGASSGAVRYVSPSGSDGADGGRADPWRTLEHALTQLRAGDELLVADGTYTERITSPELASGRTDAPIVVRAAPGARPVVRGVLWLKDADHWIFDGLNVTWDPDSGERDEHMVKLTNGTGWTFRNAEVWGARSFAAILVTQFEGDRAEPRDWTIRNNCVHSTADTNDTNQDHLIYVNTGASEGPGLIEGNLLFGAPNGEGVKFGGPDSSEGGAANVALRRNTIADTAQGVLLAWGARDITIEGNLIGGTSREAAMRGYRLDGEGNVATGNVVFGDDQIFLNDEGHRGIADGGGNVLIDSAGFDREGTCAGYRPSAAEAAGVGHLAAGGDAIGAGQPSSAPVEEDAAAGTGDDAAAETAAEAGTPTPGPARADWRRSSRLAARSDAEEDARAAVQTLARVSVAFAYGSLRASVSGGAAFVAWLVADEGRTRLSELVTETELPNDVLSAMFSLVSHGSGSWLVDVAVGTAPSGGRGSPRR